MHQRATRFKLKAKSHICWNWHTGRDWGLIFLCNDDKSRYYNQVLVRDNSGNRNMEMDLLTFLTKIVTTFDGARAEANPIGNKLDLCDLHFYDLLR